MHPNQTFTTAVKLSSNNNELFYVTCLIVPFFVAFVYFSDLFQSLHCLFVYKPYWRRFIYPQLEMFLGRTSNS